MGSTNWKGVWDDVGQFIQHLIPDYDSQWDLGHPTRRVRNIYYSGDLIGPAEEGAFIFGDGSANTVVSVNGALTGFADHLYNNLTINAGITLNVSNLTLGLPSIIRVADTLTINGSLITLGLAGANAVGATGGVGNLGPSGANGGTGAGAQATAGVASDVDLGGDGGASGAGGLGSNGAGGAGRATITSPLAGPRYLANDGGYLSGRSPLPGSLTSFYGGMTGQGGGAGGGDSTNAGGGGGAGGDPGPNVFIFARNIVVGAAGALTSTGGAGGNGAAGVAGDSGGGGGGGGAGGGHIYLVYESLTVNGSGLISSVGGAGGTPGAGVGTGVIGVVGSTGGAGRILAFDLTSGTLIDTTSITA